MFVFFQNAKNPFHVDRISSEIFNWFHSIIVGPPHWE